MYLKIKSLWLIINVTLREVNGTNNHMHRFSLPLFFAKQSKSGNVLAGGNKFRFAQWLEA